MSATKEKSPGSRGIHLNIPSAATSNRATEPRLQVNPVRVSISRITDDELAQMSANDLVDLLAYSSFVSQWADLLRELPSAGRNGLYRLALLARRRCRDEIESMYLQKGLPLPRYA
jgi:hypothetical protein